MYLRPLKPAASPPDELLPLGRLKYAEKNKVAPKLVDPHWIPDMNKFPQIKSDMNWHVFLRKNGSQPVDFGRVDLSLWGAVPYYRWKYLPLDHCQRPSDCWSHHGSTWEVIFGTPVEVKVCWNSRYLQGLLKAPFQVVGNGSSENHQHYIKR